MNAWRAAVVIAAAIVAGGCGATTVATEAIDNGRIPCEDVRVVRAGFGGDENGNVRVLSCAEAVAAAEAKLPAHGPITSVVFARSGSIYVPECAGTPVPCPFPQFGSAYFEFLDEQPMRVFVQLVDGAAVASEPEPGAFEPDLDGP